MGNVKFSEDFRQDSIYQIVERGYSVADVSRRLGVSTHSLYAWVKRYSKPPDKSPDEGQSAEIRILKYDLAGVPDERDILKRATAYFAKDAK